MADDVIINVESPQVEAPVSVDASFGNFFEGFKRVVDGWVADVKSGSDEALTGLFLGGMFLIVGVYLWRRV